MAHPHRLPSEQYRGFARYFLTICCWQRLAWFTDDDVANEVIGQLLQAGRAHHVAVLAYCLMPDHLHAICEATSDRTDFLRFVSAFKQSSGYRFGRRSLRRLWQRGFFDRHLREHEDVRAFLRYVLENPIRNGLAETVTGYPHVGSGVWRLAELIEYVQDG